ncbi:MAG: ATP-dependent DNA ligase [Acidimicrobiia bacterium]
MALSVNPPFEPMLAKLTREMPTLPDLLFEPKWDGFRCVVFRDGDKLDLQSRNQKPLLRYFPELSEPLLAQLPDQVVLDGELVIATPSGLDFDALQLRQHPAESRIRKLAVEIPASYVAFDLLALSGESLLEEPFRDRRAGLERLLHDARPPLFLTPATLSREQALQWFDAFEGAGFDGIVAKHLASAYQPGVRAMLKVKHEHTCECVVAGYRVHKDGNGVGSLLLGLYDDDGALHHVGVASGMAAPLRRQLLDEVQPLRNDALDGHPWRDWADAMHEAAASGQRMPGGPSRWNATKDLSWEPLRIERVCEAEYEGLLSGRFRHNARFKCWRDDKRVAECTYAQLDAVAPAELLAMFG